MTHVVNVKDPYQAKGDGSNDDFNEIKAAIDAGSGYVIYFPPGTYRIAGDGQTASTLTFGGNRAVEFDPGARIRPAAGHTVLINCPVRADRYQIFDLTEGGSIRIGPLGPRTVFPEWWGAKADASANSSPAIQRAIDAITDDTSGARGGEVVFSAGEYQLINTIVLPRGYDKPKLTLRGAGVFATALHAPTPTRPRPRSPSSATAMLASRSRSSSPTV